MFAAGDYVVYGQSGICQVLDVTTMDMDGIPKDRLYYVLRPDGKDTRIFAPVENNRLVLRRIMTREEAESLMQEIPEMEALQIPDDKHREEQYRQCIKSCQSREIVRMVKTICLRKRERLARGKKATATDEKYLKMAADSLYSELSMLLSIPKNEMESYISKIVEEQK